MEISPDVFNQALSAIALLLLTLLSFAAKEATQWLRSKRKTGAASDLIEQVMTAASMVVARNMQTIVEDLKAAAADGKITAEEREKILSDAISDVISHVGPSLIAQMGEDRARKLVADAIESQVAKWKSLIAAPMIAPPKKGKANGRSEDVD